MVRDARVSTKVFNLYICMLSCIRERSFAPTSNRPAIHWSNKVNHITTRGRLDEAYSDNEVSVPVHACVSFAPKIALVVDNHSLFAIPTSEVVERNIIAYLLNDEASNDEGSVVIYHLLLQCVDVDNFSTRRCTDSRWDPADRMTGCLVALVTCVLQSDDGVVVAVRWVVEHKVSHSNKVECRRMNDSLKNGRLIYV